MSQPLYGGTETLIDKTLPNFGIRAVSVLDSCDRESIMGSAQQALDLARKHGGRVGLFVTETPANPTNSLVDLKLMR